MHDNAVREEIPAVVARQSLVSKLYHTELVRFGCVGTVCFVFQLLLMHLLIAKFGIRDAVANGAAWSVAASANFVMTFCWTFRQRGFHGVDAMFTKALGFYPVVVLGLGVNTLVYALARTRTPSHLYAAIVAWFVTATVTWLLQSRAVFRRRHAFEEIPHAPMARLTELAAGGVAMFLPAYNEEGNIRRAVEGLLDVLERLAVPHRVFIIDDGSTDQTAAVSADLAQTYASVEHIRHAQNGGYGAALCTGFSACRDSGLALAGFHDADMQFSSDSLLALLTRMLQTGADVVVGHRVHRADGLVRKLTGRAWHMVTRLACGFNVSDVDCGFKIFQRHVIEAIADLLDGGYATVSPQLLAFAAGSGYTVTETAVTHMPRTAGHNTGLDPKVVVGSFKDLGRVRQATRKIKIENGVIRERFRRLRQVNPVTVAVFLAAAAISVVTYIYYYSRGVTLEYGDAVSHLLIARRVVDGLTPGYGQLGGVWLPLPHTLELPLIWNNWAYYTGFAGSIVSMVAYVAATVLIFKFVYRLTHQYLASIAGAAVFALNPNVLYMSTTPMTELLMFATMMGAVYGVLCWVQTSETNPRRHLYLFGAGASLVLACLTRYEGWTLGIALMAVVLYCLLGHVRFIPRVLVVGTVMVLGLGTAFGLEHLGLYGLAILPIPLIVYRVAKPRLIQHGWNVVEGTFVTFAWLAVVGPLFWMLWNQLLFGDYLGFKRGPYASPSLWVSKGDKAVHHLWIALRTYQIASFDNLTPVIVVLALVGLVVYLVRTRLSRESLPALSLLAFFPFFVVTLYAGLRPLHVYQYYYAFYNVRFGLVMILPAAILIGYLAGQVVSGFKRYFRILRFVAVVPVLALTMVIGVLGVTAVQSGNVVTLQEPVAGHDTIQTQHALEAAGFLRTNWQSGRVLMESYGNEAVAFYSRVPMEDQVYEGSYRMWLPALSNPSGHHIVWVVMRQTPNNLDLVYKSLYGTTAMDGYTKVYANGDLIIYASPQGVRQIREASRLAAARAAARAVRHDPAPPALADSPAQVQSHPVSARLADPRRPRTVDQVPHGRTSDPRERVVCPDGVNVRARPTTAGNLPVGAIGPGDHVQVLRTVSAEMPYAGATNKWAVIARSLFIWAGCLSM
jgi:glycosyltransferase involved in cell wall biosynthesis/putative flippase GtrA